ncbi:hypothetical protein OH76DRAFT_1343377 [Lentinus brumalis]|uniref:Zn(2)-C6 fungal-type domain-containing protein n=1 Tax=Lentinus brumalis TaxID=2498619 RepID=A0A371DL70_9APHY|nr:hypothetical protein OH76DRAFT_1343377 [Polyporus brumalis]
MSHAPSIPGPSHGHGLTAGPSSSSARSAATGSSTGRSRREKARLELAPDQPLTTQGKARTRVYVACIQCRNRKIRCDGAKPVCHNCSRRTDNSQVCNYDAAPKRRGPDRTPGARQRSVGGSSGERPQRKRRRVPAQDESGRVYVSHQSTSPDGKSASFSPTTHSFMADAVASRPDGLTIIQEVGPTHYNRRRQGLPDARRPSDAASAHYARHHDLPISSHVAAAYEAIPLGSSLTDAPRPVGYAVGAPTPQALPVASINERGNEYGFETGREEEDQKGAVITADPGLQFTRETWWDALLVLYANDGGGGGSGAFDMTLATPPGLRENTAQNITADLRAIFRASPHWFNFINLPRFFASLLDPRARHSIQPSLILGALALATFFRSHEGELGAGGRERALRLRDQAQSALEGSLSSRWVDHSLVQASWLLAFFEICAHPLHSTSRVRSSMGLLDSLLRTMKLLTLDEGNPRVSLFSSNVPVVPVESSRLLPGSTASLVTAACNCRIFTLGHTWPMVQEFAPLWDMTPTWQSEWTESDIRKEECRRLVWSSVMLSAGHSSYTAASLDIQTQQLFLMDPINYALLFPGESLTSADDSPAIPPPSKDSVWALYMRAMLMWNSCIRRRSDSDLSDADKAQFALTAWAEINTIEEALGRHTCGIERSFLFQGRELLFNSRMCIAYEFQRCLPQAMAHTNLLFYRRKAEEWLTHQASLAKRVVNLGLSSVTGLPAADLAKRPFLLFWFMSQIERALSLWSYDRTLSVALDVAKTLSKPVEYLMTLWPCPEQRRRWDDLRERLNSSCYAASVPLLPANGEPSDPVIPAMPNHPTQR